MKKKFHFFKALEIKKENKIDLLTDMIIFNFKS